MANPATIVDNQHDDYEQFLSIWKRERKPRRIIIDGTEFSAVKDGALKFVPVDNPSLGSLHEAYASDMTGKTTPKKTPSRKKKTEESEGSPDS